MEAAREAVPSISDGPRALDDSSSSDVPKVQSAKVSFHEGVRQGKFSLMDVESWLEDGTLQLKEAQHTILSECVLSLFLKCCGQRR